MAANAGHASCRASEKDETMREVFQQDCRGSGSSRRDRELVATSIENATRAFNESNVSLAEEVIADDDMIDAIAVASTSWPSRSSPVSSRSPAICASS